MVLVNILPLKVHDFSLEPLLLLVDRMKVVAHEFVDVKVVFPSASRCILDLLFWLAGCSRILMRIAASNQRWSFGVLIVELFQIIGSDALAAIKLRLFEFLRDYALGFSS